MIQSIDRGSTGAQLERIARRASRYAILQQALDRQRRTRMEPKSRRLSGV